MSKPILTARGIRKSFRMGRTNLEVLRGCDIDIAQGEFVAIMGKSGSGKSTLMHILGALDSPDDGTVEHNGRPTFRGATRATPWEKSDVVLRILQRILVVLLVIAVVLGGIALLIVPLILLILRWIIDVPNEITQVHLVAAFSCLCAMAVLSILLVALFFGRLLVVELTERQRTALRRRDIGFVFQAYHLLPELRVLENVRIARMVAASTFAWPLGRRQARQDAIAILKRVGLEERLHHRPRELSGGERQRVAIARALIHKPRILLADEPTGNLDAEAGAALMQLIEQLHDEGQTIVIVTHDPAVAQRANRVLMLEAGRLRAV